MGPVANSIDVHYFSDMIATLIISDQSLNMLGGVVVKLRRKSLKQIQRSLAVPPVTKLTSQNSLQHVA